MSAGLTISLRRAAKGSSRFNVAARNFAGVAGAPLPPAGSAIKTQAISMDCEAADGASRAPGKGKGGRQATTAPDRRRLGRRRTVDQNPPGARGRKRSRQGRPQACGPARKLMRRAASAAVAQGDNRDHGAHRQRPAPLALLSRRFRFGLEFVGFKRMTWSPLPGARPRCSAPRGGLIAWAAPHPEAYAYSLAAMKATTFDSDCIC